MSFSKVYQSSSTYWHEHHTIEFNELILSWNGKRPEGVWTFYISVKAGEWLKFAQWGKNRQRSFLSIGEFAKSFQDTVTCEKLCTEFRVKVEGDQLEKLDQLIVCATNTEKYAKKVILNLPDVLLEPIYMQSQMTLPHPKKTALCAPTSMTTALRSLRAFCDKQEEIVRFAEAVYDEGFQIYGNWSFSIAESYNVSQKPCHVERLADIQALHAHLLKANPVVVSVQGEIENAPLPYLAGHLMCVVGFQENHIVCIDSAFETDHKTLVKYPLESFVNAWGRRKNLGLVFHAL